MQNNEKIPASTTSSNPLDLLPFKDLWFKLDKDIKHKCTLALFRAQVASSTQTFYLWYTEKRTPSYISQVVIAKTLNKILGTHCTPATLFPRKKVKEQD